MPVNPIDDSLAYAQCKSGDIAVYLGHRRIGTISRVSVGYWAYYPAGSKSHGEAFSSVSKVQHSLEAE